MPSLRLTSTTIAHVPVPLDQDLVHVAPEPVFSGLEGFDYRVARRMEVLRGVAVGAGAGLGAPPGRRAARYRMMPFPRAL